jgi:hypothetical protein
LRARRQSLQLVVWEAGVNEEHEASKDRAALFRTTHWSLVLAACDSQAPGARSALAELCGIYWYPLYAHVRRHGFNPDNAQDLTQGFFQHLLERKVLKHADSAKGKFRSFLLGSLDNYLGLFRQHENAIKRGGGRELISLDVAEAESRYEFEAAEGLTAEQMFDARWQWRCSRS